MNFTITSVSNSKKIDSLSKKPFFLKKSMSKNVAAVHSNSFDDLNHLVFKIEDEYIVTTSKRGPQFNFPYSSLINTFYKHNSSLLLIEHENSSFDDLIINELKTSLKVEVKKREISSQDYLCIYKKFSSKIKKIEYTNIDEEIVSLDFMNNNDFFNLLDTSNSIDYLTLNFNNRFLTIKQNGNISIDNDDEKYLVDVVSRLFECIG